MTSHGVTKAPSWIFMAAFLDFWTLSKCRQNFFLLQNCWIISLDNLYSPFCQYLIETSTKIWNENTNGPNMTWGRAPEFGCHGNRLINFQNLTTQNCSQVNLRISHEVGTLQMQSSWVIKDFSLEWRQTPLGVNKLCLGNFLATFSVLSNFL